MLVSVQTPAHVDCPVGHPHALLLQAWPPAHAFVQKPQLSGSVVVFVQAMPQAISVPGHVATHVFCEQ